MSLIDREEALDLIFNWKAKEPWDEFNQQVAFEIIHAMPSAEPEIIHCYDCVYYSGKNHPWGVCKIHRGAVANKNRLCQGIDYCSWAERREE